MEGQSTTGDVSWMPDYREDKNWEYTSCESMSMARDLGEQGWEMVSAIHRQDGVTIFYFKRKK